MKKIGYIFLILLMLGISIAPVRAIDPDVYHGETGTEEDTSDRSETWGDTSIDKNNTNTYKKIACGDTQIPYIAPKIVSTIITVLQIATPILLIIFGSLDLVKAVITQKEDEIKKGQHTFVRRLLAGAVVFLAFYIVEVVIGIVAPHNENQNMWNCVDCFVTGDCDDLMVGNK